MEISGATSLTIGFFNEQRQRGNIILDPEYQRRLVWGSQHKVYLIDTILKGLPMPKFFVEIKVEPKSGKTLYNIVDGQQRLDAIFGFVDGKFSLSKKDHPFPSQLDHDLDEVTFRELPSKLQEKFWSYSLTVQELRNATSEEIKEMFVRLNKNNVKLNDQELRNALYDGDFKQLSDELANEFGEYYVDNRIMPLSSIRRMIDVEFTAELLGCMLYGIQDKKKKLNKIHAENEEMDDEVKTYLKKNFTKIFDLIQEILGDDLKSTRFKNKADFYTLFYLFFELLKENYKFKEEQFGRVKRALIKIHNSVSLNSKDPNLVKYYEGAVNSPDSESNRKHRYVVLRDRIEPFLLRTDRKRLFTEDERQKIWHSSNKICAVCGHKVVRYDDYEPDHKVRWASGGLTNLENAQVAHKKCNRSKN